DAAAAAVGTGDQTLVSIAVRLARRPHEAGTAGPAAGLAQHRAPPPDSTPDSETGEKWQRPETYRVGPLPKARGGERVSDRRSAEAFAGHQLAGALTRLEHPGLPRVGRHADNVGDLLDGLLVVVDQIDDLAMRRRQLGQALPQNRRLLPLLHRDFGTVRRILDELGDFLVQLFSRAPAQHR